MVCADRPFGREDLGEMRDDGFLVKQFDRAILALLAARRRRRRRAEMAELEVVLRHLHSDLLRRDARPARGSTRRQRAVWAAGAAAVCYACFAFAVNHQNVPTDVVAGAGGREGFVDPRWDPGIPEAARREMLRGERQAARHQEATSMAQLVLSEDAGRGVGLLRALKACEDEARGGFGSAACARAQRGAIDAGRQIAYDLERGGGGRGQAPH
jgi:hypothetical protein